MWEKRAACPYSFILAPNILRIYPLLVIYRHNIILSLFFIFSGEQENKDVSTVTLYTQRYSNTSLHLLLSHRAAVDPHLIYNLVSGNLCYHIFLNILCRKFIFLMWGKVLIYTCFYKLVFKCDQCFPTMVYVWYMTTKLRSTAELFWNLTGNLLILT